MVKPNRKVIPVVFATDDNYFMPTCVSITSLLANAKEDTFYDIYIFVNDNFPEDYKKKTEKFYETFDNFKITYKNFEDDFNNIIVENINLKAQAYYKLDIPKKLIQYGKCIYLAGDTIIEKDLMELYNSNIGNYYIGEVKTSKYHWLITKKEGRALREKPAIIHFDSEKAKPWENIRVIFADAWWKYALISPFKDILSTLKSKIETEVDFFKLVNFFKTKEEIILFGYSEIGKKLYQMLIDSGINKIVCFCDNDAKKRNESFKVPVLDIEEALERYPNSYILITSQNYHRDIKKQLLKLGVGQDRIYRHIRKEYEYYMTLAPKYYEREVEEKGWIDTGNYVNLKSPKTFNEKVNWLKLYDRNPEKTILSDKFLVREEVSKKIGDQYLIPLLGVYNNFDEIEFNKLPTSFVIKANHGSGWNIIVKDKSLIDMNDVKEKINRWLNTNYAYMFGLELQYLDIPRKIIIEKYIEDSKRELLDYKFLCFDGRVEYFWVDIDRYKNHTRNVYDRNWVKQEFNITYQNSKKDILKPNNFDEMIKIAEELSKGFRHVRIDLYNVDGQIYFGEYTFSSCNGNEKILPNEYNIKLGSLINL